MHNTVLSISEKGIPVEKTEDNSLKFPLKVKNLIDFPFKSLPVSQPNTSILDENINFLTLFLIVIDLSYSSINNIMQIISISCCS